MVFPRNLILPKSLFVSRSTKGPMLPGNSEGKTTLGGITNKGINLQEWINWSISNEYIEIPGVTSGTFTSGSVPFAGADGKLTEDNTNFKYLSGAFTLDGDVSLGDVDGSDNSTVLTVDDTNTEINLDVSGAAGLVQLGDVSANGNTTVFTVFDTGRLASLSDSSGTFFTVSNVAGVPYGKIGDSDTYIELSESSGHVLKAFGVSGLGAHSIFESSDTAVNIDFYNSVTGNTTSDGFRLSVTSSTVDLVNRENGPIQFYTNNLQRVYITAVGDMHVANNATIGDNTVPNAASVLDLVSTTRGFLPPRMTAVQASAITPVDGLMLYTTSTDATFTQIGFWGYVNGTWTALH